MQGIGVLGALVESGGLFGLYGMSKALFVNWLEHCSCLTVLRLVSSPVCVHRTKHCIVHARPCMLWLLRGHILANTGGISLGPSLTVDLPLVSNRDLVSL